MTRNNDPTARAPTGEPVDPAQAKRRNLVTNGPLGRTVFILALPVLAEQILNTLVGTFDTFLAGQISPAATSAVGLAAYIGWLVSLLAMLIGTGTTALVSRHEGAGDHEEANRLANESLMLAAGLGVSVFALVFTLAPWFASSCRMSGEAFDISVHYLRVDAVGHMFASVTLIGCAALRGVGNMRTPMLVFALLNTVNIIASYALVYGLGPIPALGVKGIVVGTVIARTTGALLTVAVLLRGRSGLLVAGRYLHLTMSRTRRLLRIGLPAAADGAIMWIGNFVFLAIIARLAPAARGEAIFAAHIIAVRIEALTYLPALAWATATATIIGQTLGAKNPDRARRAGHLGVLQCGSLSIVAGVLFFFGAQTIYDVMSADPLVREVGARPFRYLAFLQPFLVVSIIYIHSLRGAGDTRFPLLITMVGVCIRMLAGYVCGIVLHGGLLGAWMGMYGDNVWRAIAGTVRYSRGRWIKTQV